MMDAFDEYMSTECKDCATCSVSHICKPPSFDFHEEFGDDDFDEETNHFSCDDCSVCKLDKCIVPPIITEGKIPF